jgi:hypothetical protein
MDGKEKINITGYSKAGVEINGSYVAEWERLRTTLLSLYPQANEKDKTVIKIIGNLLNYLKQEQCKKEN